MEDEFPPNKTEVEFHTNPIAYLKLLDVPLVGDYRKLEGKARHKYRTIYQMLRIWGHSPGHTCRGCKHLVHKQGDFQGRFLKCRVYEGARQPKNHPWRMGGPTSDWRAYYPACGRFDPLEESET